jgi:hypothetical protein
VFVFAFWFFLYPKPQTLEPFFEILTAQRISEHSSHILLSLKQHIRLFHEALSVVLRTDDGRSLRRKRWTKRSVGPWTVFAPLGSLTTVHGSRVL